MEQETTAAPKTFVIKNLVDVDPMTIYRETATQMEVGQLVDLMPDEAVNLIKAIVEIHGERTFRTEATGAGGIMRRVIRVEQRPLKARVPKAKKAEATKKPAAKNA